MPYGKGRSFVYLGLIRSMKTSMKQQDMEQGQVYVVGIAAITSMHSFPGISTPAYTQEMLDDYSAKNVDIQWKAIYRV